MASRYGTRLVSSVLVGICAIAAGSTDNYWIRYPEISIPKLAKAPVIDGVIHAQEWALATRDCGLVYHTGAGVQKQIEAPFHFCLGWGEGKLFFAFHEVRPEDHLKPYVISPGKGDNTKDNSPVLGDCVELRLSPSCKKVGARKPFEDYVEFFLNYVSDYVCRNGSTAQFDWDGKMAYRARRTPDGWEGEVAVSLADIPWAESAVKPGDRWGIGVMRNRRTPAPVVGLWEPRCGAHVQYWNFPHAWAHFTDGAPVVRIHKLGVLSKKRIGLDMELVNPAAQDFQVKVSIALLKRESGKALPFYDSIENLVARDGQIVIGKTDWAIEQALKAYAELKSIKRSIALRANTLTPVGFAEEPGYGSYLLLMHVADAKTGRTLYGRSVPFDFKKESRLNVALDPYYLASNTVIATLQNPGKTLSGNRIAYQVLHGGSACHQATMVVPRRSELRIQIPVQRVPFGSQYRIRFTLIDKNGSTMEDRSFVMQKPEKPVWHGHEIGITDNVPAPWSPVQASGSSCKVWNREYRFAGHWLPSAITSNKAQMLSSPVRLLLRNGKHEQNLASGEARIEEQTPRAVTYAFQKETTTHKVSARSRVEFDGFCWFTVDLEPKGSLPLDELALVIPVKKEHARFYQEADLMGFKNKRLAPEGRCGALPQSGISNSWMYRLYVGDYERGLWWFTESSKDWNTETTPDTVQIKPVGSEVLIKIALRRGRESLSQPLHYEFGLHAAPIKPIPLRVRKARYSHYHTGYHLENLESLLDLNRSFFKIQTSPYPLQWYNIFAAWNFKTYGQPFPHDEVTEERLKRLCDFMRGHGAKAMVYAGWGVTYESKWVAQAYGTEMASRPLLNHFTKVYKDCPGSAFADYYLGGAEYLADKCDVQGVYLDGTMEVASCAAIGHGCGWMDDKGEIHPTYPVLGTRDLFMRLYQFYGERFGYENTFIYSHLTRGSFAPVTAFATVRLCGEGEGTIPTLAAAFPIEKVAARSNPAAEGVPLDVLSTHLTPQMTTDTVTAVGLQFNVLPTVHVINYFDRDRNLQPVVPPTQPPFLYLPRLAALRRIMSLYPWAESTFMPFYKNRDMVQVRELDEKSMTEPKHKYKPRMLAGLHYNAQKGTGILFVSNLYRQYKKTARITLNLSKLGLPSNVRIVLPLVGGEVIKHRNGEFDLTVHGNDFEMLVIGNGDWDGALRPWLRGR